MKKSTSWLSALLVVILLGGAAFLYASGADLQGRLRPRPRALNPGQIAQILQRFPQFSCPVPIGGGASVAVSAVTSEVPSTVVSEVPSTVVSSGGPSIVVSQVPSTVVSQVPSAVPRCVTSQRPFPEVLWWFTSPNVQSLLNGGPAVRI